MAKQSTTLILLLAGSAALAACSPKPPKQLPPEPGDAATSTDTGQGTVGAPVPGSQADFVATLMGADTIYFDTDKDRLKDESGPVLEQVQALLEARPGLRLVVAGHTDAEGADAHNLDLSNRRAAAVVAWLVARGIAADRLQSEGHGEGRPVAGNDSAAGRALNRRVELREAAASADG